MVSRNTVFIIGAGASIPFGFPSGLELKYKIINLISDDNCKIKEEAQIFIACGFSETELIDFRNQLIFSQKNSIDAFLEHRNEFIDLGKTLITYELLKTEILENVYRNSDWYNYIWNKLDCKLSDFKNNNITFLTFNYDRSLETYLARSMASLYNINELECYPKLRIIHLHGKLGLLPFESSTESIAFGEKIEDPSKLLKASRNIKIITENIRNTTEFILAHQSLSMAEIIVILGFGYDETNLERLNLKQTNASIIGSSYGLTKNTCKSINKLHPEIQFSDNTNHKCLDFLRESVEIF